MSGPGVSTAGVALVTGATGGLGLAIAERLAAGGWDLALTYRSSEAAAVDLRERLRARGRRVETYALDASDAGRPKALVREIDEQLGPVTALVNNLGQQESRLLAMTPDDLWARMLDINLSAAFRLCRAVAPGMVRQRQGSVVNVSSLGALRGVAGESAYSAAKAGLIAMTRSFARELGKRGVRANCVVPGFVETEMTSELSEEQVAALRQNECLPGPTLPEDVAHAVAFLMSEESRAITGQCLVVDSGVSC